MDRQIGFFHVSKSCVAIFCSERSTLTFSLFLSLNITLYSHSNITYGFVLLSGSKCTCAVSPPPVGAPEASWMIYCCTFKLTVPPNLFVFPPSLPSSVSSPAKNGSTVCTAITCQLCMKRKDYCFYYVCYLVFTSRFHWTIFVHFILQDNNDGHYVHKFVMYLYITTSRKQRTFVFSLAFMYFLVHTLRHTSVTFLVIYCSRLYSCHCQVLCFPAVCGLCMKYVSLELAIYTCKSLNIIYCICLVSNVEYMWQWRDSYTYLSALVWCLNGKFAISFV